MSGDQESPGLKWMRERRKPWRAEGLDLSMDCPEHDRTVMASTGNLFFDPKFGDWYVEYRCPVDDELFTIYSPGRQAVVEAAPKRPLS